MLWVILFFLNIIKAKSESVLAYLSPVCDHTLHFTLLCKSLQLNEIKISLFDLVLQYKSVIEPKNLGFT